MLPERPPPLPEPNPSGAGSGSDTGAVRSFTCCRPHTDHPTLRALPTAGSGLDPILAYNAGAEINQLQWSASQPDWVAICFGNKAQILRV